MHSLVPGRCGSDLELVIFNIISRLDSMSICGEIATQVNVTTPRRWLLNIRPGNKPLPEPMFIQICVDMWRHQATMS